MAYPDPPSAARGLPPEETLREFLLDLGARKEFRALRPLPPSDAAAAEAAAALGLPAFGAPAAPGGEEGGVLAGLRLQGAQLFVRNFENPDTPYPRLLLNWQTGTGKTIGALAIAQEFVRQFRSRVGVAPPARPSVFVIGFTRTIIQAELLNHPEFGFVAPAEVAELQRLRGRTEEAGGDAATPEGRALAAYVAVLKRRFTDRARGGYYQFYGYKEFGNRLFAVTRRGAAKGFSVQGLYVRDAGAPPRARPDRSPEGREASSSSDEEEFDEAALLAGAPSFLEKIDAAVAEGLIEVNRDLLDALKGGLLVADEVHNTYNVRWKNNYGIAVQYALDKLSEEGEAPRAVFMSATVTSGSATEVIDLLNLLVPLAALPGGRRLRREDFFEAVEAGGGKEVRPRPGALDRIGRLSAGRVSFLLDAGEGDAGGYPRRVFEGDPLADPLAPGKDIAYLRFAPCPMSPFHARTLAHMLSLRKSEAPPAAGGEAPRVAIPANAYALYDIAYPNPAFPPDAAAAPGGDSYGLYLSAEAPHLLSVAPQAWRDAAGVVVEGLKGGEARAGAPLLIGGAFLAAAPPPRAPPGVAAYSTKYRRLVEDTIAFVRAGPGKAMIYHHRVRMSGVLQIQELLRENGFADEASAPTAATLCAVCGRPRGGHPAAPPHDYAPARFVIVNSELDRSAIEASLARFNAPSNLEGHSFRVLIGSKIIREGYNLKAVRLQQIAALPTDIPTLIQVLGRAVRKGSHAALPPDQREVRVRVYVSTAGEGAPLPHGAAAPEVRRYAEKVRSYHVTQEVEKALRIYAVDSLLAGRGGLSAPASLDAIPYRPAVSPEELERRPETLATFSAYGHGKREVHTLAAAIRALFRVRPVWTYGDLWGAVRTPGAVRNLAVAPESFTEDHFAAALGALARHSPSVVAAPAAGGDPRAAGLVARAGEFYVWVPAGAGGQPLLDVESYVREGAALLPVALPVAAYAQETRTASNFAVRLAEFELRYASSERPIEGLFADYDGDFHYALLRLLVDARASGRGAAHGRLTSPGAPLARAEDLYGRFRVLVRGCDFLGHPDGAALLRSARPAPRAPIGFVAAEAIRLRGEGGRWYDIPRKSLGVGPRYEENGLIVGYFERRGGRLRFKVRPPRQALAKARVRDARSLERGAVCGTRPRREQEELATRLRAVRAAELPSLSSEQLCDAVRDRLLLLEEGARAGARGMEDGLRYFYLWNDPMPLLRTRK